MYELINMLSYFVVVMTSNEEPQLQILLFIILVH